MKYAITTVSESGRMSLSNYRRTAKFIMKIKYKYDRNRALELLLDKASYENWEKAEADVLRTETFIDYAFNDFEGKTSLDNVSFAFCIPTRASRFNSEYWEEVYDFLPGLKHLDIETRFAILASMPPFRVETYGKPGEPSKGVVVFVPIFNDMLRDYRNKLLLRRVVTKRINDATDFAHRQFGVQYIGLGATLPKLTKFGRTIRADVVTTTGHGGTVWLMEQIFNEVLRKYFNGRNKHELKVGFIGAGSIGTAALENIGLANKEIKYRIFDIRPIMNQRAKERMDQLGVDVEISSSNSELIQECDIILSAITSRIDISGIDLSDKVIIDDSQPAQFLRDEVRDAGGVLVWVVGNDASKEKLASRKDQYSYGVHGLCDSSDLWGCEAEVATIAHFDRPDLAINSDVTSDQVNRIGELLTKAGIRAAKFQSFGRLNDE